MIKTMLPLILFVSFFIFFNCSSSNLSLKQPCINIEKIELVDSVDQIAHPVNGWDSLCSRIVYPKIAKDWEIGGRVFIEVTVDKNGQTLNENAPSKNRTLLLRGIGAGCDEAALTAVRNTRFIPPKKNGKPITARMRIVFFYQIYCAK